MQHPIGPADVDHGQRQDGRHPVAQGDVAVQARQDMPSQAVPAFNDREQQIYGKAGRREVQGIWHLVHAVQAVFSSDCDGVPG